MASDILFTVFRKDKETHDVIGESLSFANPQKAKRAAQDFYSHPVEFTSDMLDSFTTAGSFEENPPDGTYTVIRWEKQYPPIRKPLPRRRAGYNPRSKRPTKL